jgi:hypothetical protein
VISFVNSYIHEHNNNSIILALEKYKSENNQKCIKEVKTTKNAKKCKIKIEL